MDLYDLEAMFIRRDGAHKLLHTVAGEELLLMIVAPKPDLLAASLKVAHEQGLRGETLKHRRYVADNNSRPKKVTKKPRTCPGLKKKKRQVVSIDELLA